MARPERGGRTWTTPTGLRPPWTTRLWPRRSWTRPTAPSPRPFVPRGTGQRARGVRRLRRPGGAAGGRRVRPDPPRGILVGHGGGRPRSVGAPHPASGRPARAPQVPTPPRPHLRSPPDEHPRAEHHPGGQRAHRRIHRQRLVRVRRRLRHSPAFVGLSPAGGASPVGARILPGHEGRHPATGRYRSRGDPGQPEEGGRRGSRTTSPKP